MMIWCAYHHDFSEFAVFPEEIDALRYAVENKMEVSMIEYGMGVREQINRPKPRADKFPSEGVRNSLAYQRDG